MEIAVLHKVYYSNKQPMLADDVAKAIMAFAELARAAGPLAELLVEGLHITNIDVVVDDLETGSLSEVFKLKIYAKFQESITKKLQEIARQRRWKALDDYAEDVPKIITMLLIGLLALAAAEKAKVILDGAKPTYIINLYNSEAQKLADCIGIPLEDLDRCVKGYTAKNFKRLGKHSLNAVTPAKREDSATMLSIPLTPSGGDGATLDSNTLKEVPYPWEIQIDAEDDIKKYDNIYLKIIGKRRNSSKKGWRAVVPELGDAEVAVTLSPAVSPEDLWKKGDDLRGSGIVVFRRSRDGVMSPHELHLLEVRPDPISGS
ncbi:hypothetical protein MCP1_240036 [Candidatus Terasakiella magnetica]|nr:hypothetical protein MCP1_240036 [Candidatus Terasakiella magnetica]